jgi:hypothetical protein
MRYRLLTGMAAIAIASALGSGARAQVVPMYSLEGGLQGFGPNGGGVTVSADTVGATDGTGSLKVSVVQGATFVGALTGSVVPPMDNPNLTSIGVDVTVPGQFPGAFALIGVTIFGASQPSYPGGQLFGLQYQSTNFAHLEPLGPGTYHLDLGPLNGTNPLTFDTNQSYAQVFGSGPNQLIPTGFQFFFNKSNDAPLTVYLDNVTGAVPEPAAVSAMGLAGLALLRRRKA